jgi:hypothetical protein
MDHPMSLADMEWKRVNLHPVVLTWLRAERGGYVEQARKALGLSLADVADLLDSADLANPDQNRARLRLLYGARNIFSLEIPPDTEWYNVRNLKHEHLNELLVVNHPAWNDPAHHNELHEVAKLKNRSLEKPPSEWDSPILWGHDRNGPFTIMEGNNRLASYVASGRTDLDIPAFIGLSPLKCLYHLPDGARPLIRDMLGG